MSQSRRSHDTKWGWYKRNAPLLLLVVLVLSIVSWVATGIFAKFPAPEVATGYITALGAVLSVIGLVVSLGGFAVTLQQISLAQSAIEAAKEESERIRLSLKTYDATQDSTRAELSLRDAKKFFDDGNLEAGGNSYANCASSLMMIRNNVDDLPADLAGNIDQADKYIEGLCVRIDRGVAAIDAKQKSEMRSHDRLIRLVQAHLQRSAI